MSPLSLYIQSFHQNQLHRVGRGFSKVNIVPASQPQVSESLINDLVLLGGCPPSVGGIEFEFVAMLSGTASA